MNDSTAEDGPAFRIFRGAEAPSMEASGVERHRPGDATAPQEFLDVFTGLADPGYSHKTLFAGKGMSLLHLWFKSGFALPRHSHDTDCVYFVLAGGLRVGTNDLGPGDGFFVGAGVPYTYTAGEAGVEILEFRAAEQFFLDLLVKNPAFWQKFAGTAQAKQASWPDEKRPLSNRA